MSIKIESSFASTASDAARAFGRGIGDEVQVGGEAGASSALGEHGLKAASEVREAGRFAAVLEKTALAASAKEREAVAKADALAEGRIDDLHGTMITMKEADISLKLVGSVRDKLMDAFHELWRINV